MSFQLPIFYLSSWAQIMHKIIYKNSKLQCIESLKLEFEVDTFFSVVYIISSVESIKDFKRFI